MYSLEVVWSVVFGEVCVIVHGVLCGTACHDMKTDLDLDTLTTSNVGQ